MASTPAPEPPTSETTPSAYHPLFSSPDADLVLCSKDNTLFRVSSETLSRTSVWFRTMLSLPQSSSSSTSETIAVDEDADVLSGLLSIVSGMELPQSSEPSDVDILERILNAADKYEMPMAISALRLAFFSSFLDAPSPVRLYGIACRMSWEKEAKHASTRTLTLDLFAPSTLPELLALEPTHRDKLIALHRQRREQFLAAIDNSGTFYANLRVTPCNRNDGVNRCSTVLEHGAWFAFKYALVKRLECAPVGEAFDEGFYQMRELWDLRMAHCVMCKRIVYNMPNTLENLQKIVRELPKSVEVSCSQT
ncbi:hypothetical protein C8Q80DRAFT_1245400 [Daedaleopsis nitida]|nr:hypothetical protein C8Q80DRAFT_1245400 [Daedaleopsis nitida]